MDNSRKQDKPILPNPDDQPFHSNLPSVIEHDLLALGQAAFWRPRHSAASPLLGQVPFLFWLSQVVGSGLIVQLGLRDGLDYLALCQAAERLNTGSICVALQTAEGALSADLLATHDENYSDFSKIAGGAPDLASLPKDIAIDLLVIGDALDQESLAFLCDSLLPRLSEAAVIVVVDPDAVLADAAVRQVLAAKDRPRMTLLPVVPDGASIEVILHGLTQPEPLRRLVAQQPGQASWLAMRQAFNRLGQGIVAAQQVQEVLSDKKALDDRSERNESDLATLKTELKQALASENTQIQRQAELSARVHDLTKAALEFEAVSVALMAERDDLVRQVAEIAASNEGVKQDVIAQKAKVAQLQRALEAAKAEQETRIEDIIVLTNRFQNDLTATVDTGAASLAEVQTQLAQATTQLAQVTAHRNELLDSTSWKITSPMRKVVRTVRGR